MKYDVLIQSKEDEVWIHYEFVETIEAGSKEEAFLVAHKKHKWPKEARVMVLEHVVDLEHVVEERKENG